MFKVQDVERWELSLQCRTPQSVGSTMFPKDSGRRNQAEEEPGVQPPQEQLVSHMVQLFSAILRMWGEYCLVRLSRNSVECLDNCGLDNYVVEFLWLSKVQKVERDEGKGSRPKRTESSFSVLYLRLRGHFKSPPSRSSENNEHP